MTTVRRSQARGRARRQELTDAASALFAAGGSRGTGIAAVADAVGVSTTTLLYHFGCKEGLLQAVLEQRDAADREALEALLAAGGLETLRQLPSVITVWERDRGLAHLYTVLLAESIDAAAPMHEWFVGR